MDVVVTVPQRFGLDQWIGEGDPAGTEWSGQEWHFYLGGALPKINPGERVYIVYGGILRGYAPLVRIDTCGTGYGLVRHGGAIAVTIPEYIRGFRGFRYRWWDTQIEIPFPDWQNPHAYIIPGTTTIQRCQPFQPFGVWLAEEHEKYPLLYQLIKRTSQWPLLSSHKRVHEVYIILTAIDEEQHIRNQLDEQFNSAWLNWNRSGQLIVQ